MLKNIFLSLLAAILIVALSIGIYDAIRTNLWAQPAATTSTAAVRTQGGGQGNNGLRGGGQGQAGGGQNNPISGTPQPQANVASWVTLSGTVQQVQVNGVSLSADDGKLVWVQFGQSRYVEAQGVTFKVGDRLTIKGFYENGQYQAGVVTNDSTKQVLKLRDESGRPLWAGNGG